MVLVGYGTVVDMDELLELARRDPERERIQGYREVDSKPDGESVHIANLGHGVVGLMDSACQPIGCLRTAGTIFDVQYTQRSQDWATVIFARKGAHITE